MSNESESQKPVVLYLPGLDGTGRLLHRQTDLNEQFQVHCESYPQDRPQTYEELADTAAANLRAQSINGPVTVLAESFGGAVAITFALRHPELVERMVLVNTFVRFPKRIKIRLSAFVSRFFPRMRSPRFTRPIRGVFFISKDIPKPEHTVWWNQSEGVPMRAYGYRLKLIANVDLRNRLAEVPFPTLVIAAPDDRVVPHKAGVELAELLPNAKLLEPRVGHAAMIHPDLNIAKLLDDPSHWPSGD